MNVEFGIRIGIHSQTSNIKPIKPQRKSNPNLWEIPSIPTLIANNQSYELAILHDPE
jgi:hypothetical protein